MTDAVVAGLNGLSAEEFTARLGGVAEDSPWVAAEVAALRPFPGRAELADAFARVISSAPAERQLALIRAHPDLAGRAALAGELGEDSAREQAAAGLDRLTPDQLSRLTTLNTTYRERHGFPFVICAREHDADSVIAALVSRVANDSAHERRVALAEIAKIIRLRVEALA